MQIATEAAARAHAWTRDATETLRRLGHWALTEIRLTVDLPRWRQAHTPAERLAALSWPRIGAFAILPLGLIAGLYTFHILTRSDAYPPPLPSAQEIAHRRETLQSVSNTPPPSLVEANKSWKAE
jgi:hypothetical protein